MNDRNGKPVKVIYRSRKSLKPAPTNRNLTQENARRLRQMGKVNQQRPDSATAK